jgi:tRNA-specific 2-thiouridylase
VFTGGLPLEGLIECEVQVRAHGGLTSGIAGVVDDLLHVALRAPLRGVAAGQTMVVYRPDPDGDEVLASATIR